MIREEVIALIEGKADQHGCPRRILLACAYAESGLRPGAERWGAWPDISFGLFQQTVKWAKEGDHTASGANIELIRRLYIDPSHACDDAAPRMAANVRKHGDTEVALFAWNRPADPHSVTTGSKANYRRALAWADEHLARQPPPPPPPPEESMPQFQFGFADLAAQLGRDVVGEPLEDETYLGPGHSVQTTTKGLMWYSKRGNVPHFFRAARR